MFFERCDHISEMKFDFTISVEFIKRHEPYFLPNRALWHPLRVWLAATASVARIFYLPDRYEREARGELTHERRDASNFGTKTQGNSTRG